MSQYLHRIFFLCSSNPICEFLQLLIECRMSSKPKKNNKENPKDKWPKDNWRPSRHQPQLERNFTRPILPRTFGRGGFRRTESPPRSSRRQYRGRDYSRSRSRSRGRSKCGRRKSPQRRRELRKDTHSLSLFLPLLPWKPCGLGYESLY